MTFLSLRMKILYHQKFESQKINMCKHPAHHVNVSGKGYRVGIACSGFSKYFGTPCTVGFQLPMSNSKDVILNGTQDSRGPYKNGENGTSRHLGIQLFYVSNQKAASRFWDIL